MKKIALVGRMRSGKDSVGKMLVSGSHYVHINFADGIREVINTYFPAALTGSKPRKHYQVIGQSFRELDKDIWVNQLGTRVKALESVGYSGIILNTDTRQPNEVDWLRANGFTIIKVVADKANRVDRILAEGDVCSEENLEHETELFSDKAYYDYLVENNGTLADLERAVSGLKEELGWI